MHDSLLSTVFKLASHEKLFFYVADRKLRSSGTPDEMKFWCPNGCGRSYVHKTSLYLHLRRECGKEKQFKCSICQRKFTHKSSLKSHVGLVHKMLLNWCTSHFELTKFLWNISVLNFCIFELTQFFVLSLLVFFIIEIKFIIVLFTFMN